MLPKPILLMCCILISPGLLTGDPPNVSATKPIWSRKGTTFYAACESPYENCKPLKIPSPDGRSAVEVSYGPPHSPDIEVASVRVISAGRTSGKVEIVGTVEDEVVWAPDSMAFFINGNNNGNGDYHVAVHRLDQTNLGPGNVTEQVGRDMAQSFPPCKARYAIEHCGYYAAHPDEYVGMAAVDWAGGSGKVVVMAEVTCSSIMGGIMCQVLGYEVEVPSGEILRRMEAKEFRRRWQGSMAWKLRIPDPPDFQDSGTQKR